MIQQTYLIMLQFSVTDFVILLINLRINIDPIHTNFYMYNKSSFSYYSERDQDNKKATTIPSSESFYSITVLLKLRFLTTCIVTKSCIFVKINEFIKLALNFLVVVLLIMTLKPELPFHALLFWD